MAKIYELIEGDITTLEVDAIVNAANSSLLGGDGVDGAIHRAAGPELLEACRKLDGCPTGYAKITPGFKLPARYVIHAVGPVYKENDAYVGQQLSNCYLNSLLLAEENGLKTIAFPNVSTGLYGYPKLEAGRIAVNTVDEFVSRHAKYLFDKITFVCYDPENAAIYRNLLLID